MNMTLHTTTHPVDLQLETDTPEIVNECIRAVRKGGRISVIGAYAGGWVGGWVGGLDGQPHVGIHACADGGVR